MEISAQESRKDSEERVSIKPGVLQSAPLRLLKLDFDSVFISRHLVSRARTLEAQVSQGGSDQVPKQSTKDSLGRLGSRGTFRAIGHVRSLDDFKKVLEVHMQQC